MLYLKVVTGEDIFPGLLSNVSCLVYRAQSVAVNCKFLKLHKILKMFYLMRCTMMEPPQSVTQWLPSLMIQLSLWVAIFTAYTPKWSSKNYCSLCKWPPGGAKIH